MLKGVRAFPWRREPAAPASSLLSVFVFLYFAEMGTNRTTAPAAGPLPGHFGLHGGVKGQDGHLQRKRAQTGNEMKWSLGGVIVLASTERGLPSSRFPSRRAVSFLLDVLDRPPHPTQVERARHLV